MRQIQTIATRKTAARMLVLIGCAFAILISGQNLQAQTKSGKQTEEQSSKKPTAKIETPTRSDNPAAPTFLHPQKEKWQFGLEISTDAPVSGITATVPVPIEWPEQSLKIIATKKPDFVNRISFKNPGLGARQMVIRINSLRGGQKVQILFNVEVEKRITVAPQDPTQLVFATKPPAAIRKYLSPSPYIESRNRKIIKLSKAIGVDETKSAWDQVETIYKWVRDNVEYKFDKQIHTCLEALDSGHGDCEELSSLFIALCRARGIPARAVWIPDHTYPEFYLEDENGIGHWIPCQAAGSYQFGSMNEYRPILQKGDNFRIAGHKKPLRYVQPTLIAKDAAGTPAMKWIMTRVKPEPTNGDAPKN